MASRVIFLNRYFYPDHAPTAELLADLAFALARSGFTVHVITSRQLYDRASADLPDRETIGGVEVHRVWTTRRGRTSLFGRGVDYLTFYLSSGWRLFRLARKGDTIVAKTDPPLISVIASAVAQLRGANLVNWLQDMFPEVATSLGVGGVFGRHGTALLRPLRDWSIRKAQLNVALSQSMAAVLEERGVEERRIRIIPNWADGSQIKPVPPEDSTLRRDANLNGRFVVGYAGNLGRVHDLETIVDAMSIIHGRAKEASGGGEAKISFLFVGGGVQRAYVEREVVRQELDQVTFRPYQPKERLNDTLAAADLHLVSLKPDIEGLVVPSKFYSVAAAGRPTVFVGAEDGEIARLVHAHGCGLAVRSGDSAALARIIVNLSNHPEECAELGRRARAAFEARWEKAILIEAWKNALRSLGQDGA